MALTDLKTMLPVDGTNIPQEMKQRKQWVLWKPQFDKKKGSYNKVPYQISGKLASSTRPETWETFDNIYQAYQQCTRKGIKMGIGFVLSKDDDYSCIDIDGLEDVNNLPELAKEIVGLSYAETSPSGTGVHVWVRYEHNNKTHKNKNEKLGYEVYTHGRYMTFTGVNMNSLGVSKGKQIDSFIDKVFKRESASTGEQMTIKTVETVKAELVESPQGKGQDVPRGKSVLTRTEVIEKASNSKQGEQFKKLYWEGCTTESHSQADMTLCNMLAFWTNCDVQMMDEIFRGSLLFRDKWDSKRGDSTYGMNTINNAIQNVKETYTGVPVQKDAVYEGEIIPMPFFVQNGKLFKKVKDKENKGEMKDELICRQVPVIKRAYENIENPQLYYELSWVNGGRKYTDTVLSGDLASKKRLLDLSDKSLAVNDINARDLIQFFDSFVMRNDIEHAQLVERLGHVKGQFIHPLSRGNITILPPDIGERQQVEAFQTSGTTQEWIDNLLKPILGTPKAVLMVLGSFASVLLKEFKYDPFILDLSTTTSKGKTTVLYICASVWGTNHLISEWNITKVSAERKASFLNSFPLILDDTRKALDIRQLQSFVYTFSGGRSKGRGSVKGSQKELTWNNMLLSTGEVPLNDYAQSAGGVSARMIPITNFSFGDPVPDEFFNDIYDNVDKYYGTIGMEFINKWNSEGQEYKDLLRGYTKIFQSKSRGNEVVSRVARYYGLLVFTGDLLNKFFNCGIDLDALTDLFDEINENNKALDKPKQLLENILTELDSDRDSINYGFESFNTKPMKAIYRSNTLYLLPQYVKEKLGIEEKSTRDEWTRKGYTSKFENRGKYVDYKTISVNGKKFKVIEVNPQVIREMDFDFERASSYHQ